MIRLDTDAGPVKTPVAVRDEQRPLPNVPVHLREEPGSRPQAVSPPFCVSLRDEPRALPPDPQGASPIAHSARRMPIEIPTLDECDKQSQASSVTPAVDSEALREFQSKLDAILDRLRQQGSASPASPVDLSSVLAKLDDIRTDMHNTTQASGSHSPTALADLDKLNEMHTKLDALASLCQTLHDREPVQSAGGGELPEV